MSGIYATLPSRNAECPYPSPSAVRPMSTERPGRTYAAPTPPLACETNPPCQGVKAPPSARSFFNSPQNGVKNIASRQKIIE